MYYWKHKKADHILEIPKLGVFCILNGWYNKRTWSIKFILYSWIYDPKSAQVCENSSERLWRLKPQALTRLSWAATAPGLTQFLISSGQVVGHLYRYIVKLWPVNIVRMVILRNFIIKIKAMMWSTAQATVILIALLRLTHRNLVIGNLCLSMP